MRQVKLAKITTLVVILSMFFASNSYGDSEYRLPIEDGYFNVEVNQHAWTYPTAKMLLNTWLGYPAQVEWAELEHTKEIDGKFRVSLIPKVSGLEMSGNMVIMHFRKGVLHSMNGNVGFLKKDLSTIPRVNQQVAIESAALQYGLVYSLNNADAELALRNIDGENHLVWKVTISGFSQKSLKFKSLDVYIDALIGDVLHTVSKRPTANTQGTGDSYYYGNVDIDVMEELDGSYSLRDTIRNIYISNVGGQQAASQNGSSIDDFFPNRRAITSQTSNFSKGMAVKQVVISDLPDSLSGDYGVSGMSLVLPTMVIVESDGVNFDTISRYVNLDISFNSMGPLSLPMTNMDLYVPIDNSKSYQFGIQKMKINLMTASEEVEAQIFVPMGLLTEGIHEVNPNPEINIKYTIEEAENLGVDAMYAMQVAYDYYQDKFQRSGFDDENNELNVLVDGAYSFGFSQMNAMALPGPNFIAFGVGDGEYMGPLSNLDVLVHEYQHLVTENNGRGGLEYAKESGALNESWSDIFAKAIEFEVHPTSANWKLASEVSLVPGGHMRNLENPKGPNNPLSFMMPKQPDTYKGQYWFNTESQEDNGGVHYNSGVGNKWFYLLVEGESGTNDYSDEYDVEPIGLEKATTIAYTALMEKFTPTTTYPQAADLTMTVAKELYGEDSDEYHSVYEAWYAVGIFSADVSVDEHTALEKQYKLYPNPANEVLYIENSSIDAMKIEIWNVAGQRILTQNIMPGNQTLSLDGIQKGIYFVAINKNGQKSVEKLVIN